MMEAARTSETWLTSTGLHGATTQKTAIFGWYRPDDGGSKDLWNVGKLLPDYTALQPRREPSSGDIALMMEAERTSETLVNIYQTTWRYNPEDSHLRTHRRENLKSYLKLNSPTNFNVDLHHWIFFIVRSVISQVYVLTCGTDCCCLFIFVHFMHFVHRMHNNFLQFGSSLFPP
jgi:hypothetical protein